MNFDDLLNDIEGLIDLPLKSINPSTPSTTVVSIERDNEKYFVVSERSNKILKRSFKELHAIWNNLKRDGYCNVEEALQGSYTSRHQPETIFANLPYIQYFKFERRKHLILRESHQHELAELQELPTSEQKKVKSSLTAHKQFSQSILAKKLSQALSALNNEVHLLHIKQPGFLIDTNIRKILHELEQINSSVQSTAITLDVSKSKILVDMPSDLIRDNSFDMSDLVDLPSFTGVDDGDDFSKSNQEDDDDDDNDLETSELYVPNIRRQTPSLALLYERLQYDEIEIQPDYQRQDRIWKDDKRSKLIESILMGLPLPIFYFGERKNDNWVVIDGLQRITTIQDFMKGKFKLKLDKGSSVFEANGLRFIDFDRKFTRAIREFEITAYVITMEDEPSKNDSVNQFIIELFHRINTYGVKLSDQEIRSAMHFGNSVYYLKFLSSTNTFISATTDTINTKRQKDLEICLSALSFMIFGYKNIRKYNDFLVNTMDWINKQEFKKITNNNNETIYIPVSPILLSLTSNFKSSLDFCKEIFGKHAFKKVITKKKKEPISKPFFEVLVSLFSNIDESQKELIRKNKTLLISTLYNAIKTDSEEYANWSSDTYRDAGRGFHYSLSTSTGKKVTILYKFEAIRNIVIQTTGCTIDIKPLIELEVK
ncbi:MAG: DUF262 domain-containing protein [Aliivibrio sp.]|uniref:DUF262 domain-containing protein n=1 Tax=Aliivibrio sp. TaxID=1872443 RepID=UPI001A4B3267|nr:DUF262 domain-containing protein [Aliivibrio sp.]